MHILLLLVCLIGFASASKVTKSHGFSGLSGKVIGTLVTACDYPIFHTRPGSPYPDNDRASQTSFWQHDSFERTDCSGGSRDMLDVCRRTYEKNREGAHLVDRVVQDPFNLPINYLPETFRGASDKLRVYLCLGPSSRSPTNSDISEIPAPLKVPMDMHHVPSLIDVHRAYFTDQLRHLLQTTKANVTAFTARLIQEARGLVQLHRDNPQQARYALSDLLKRAHAQLNSTWIQEEKEWSKLEQAQHEDLSRQLEEDDWTGEQKLAYVLQEPGLDMHRVQTAVAQLLTHLSASVDEELRHLQTVQSHQPWTIQLHESTHGTNWTARTTANVVSLEAVHGVLLKHVRTATMAINSLRSLIAKQPGSRTTTYEAPLMDAYTKLQARLLEAQRQLNAAKSRLMAHLTQRMDSLIDRMHNQLKPGQHEKSSTEADEQQRSFTEWLRSKHHAELAYIDLLVSQLLGPYAGQLGPQDELTSIHSLRPSKENPIWQPSPMNPSISRDGLFNGPPSEPPRKKTIFGSRLSQNAFFLLVLGASLSGLLLLTSLISYCLYRHVRGQSPSVSTAYAAAGARRSQWSHFTRTRTEKLRHWMQRWPITSSTLNPTRTGSTVPVWKVSGSVVVLPSDQQAPTRTGVAPSLLKEKSESAHGYLNPIYPEC